MTPDLVVAPCSHAAARYAVEHWHYSGRMPVGKIVKHGAWEGDRFVGAVLYSWGANHNLSRQFDLEMHECAELVRVALDHHEAPVSEIVARSVALLRRSSPGLRVLVSFADPEHGHHGGIYQAMNWLYLGTSTAKRELRLRGRLLNRRAFTGRQFHSHERSTIPAGAEWVEVAPKHRYALPLDRAMRRRLEPRALPFPTRSRAQR